MRRGKRVGPNFVSSRFFCLEFLTLPRRMCFYRELTPWHRLRVFRAGRSTIYNRLRLLLLLCGRVVPPFKIQIVSKFFQFVSLQQFIIIALVFLHTIGDFKELVVNMLWHLSFSRVLVHMCVDGNFRLEMIIYSEMLEKLPGLPLWNERSGTTTGK